MPNYFQQYRTWSNILSFDIIRSIYFENVRSGMKMGFVWIGIVELRQQMRWVDPHCNERGLADDSLRYLRNGGRGHYRKWGYHHRKMGYQAAISVNKISATSRTMRIRVSWRSMTNLCPSWRLTDGQYVDLSLNPERFTGYAGPSAHHVWQTIYEENCFGLSEASLDTTHVSDKLGMTSMAAGFSASGGSPGTSGLSHGWGTDMIKSTTEGEMCEEKKVYYRVISGQLPGPWTWSIADCQVYMLLSRYISVMNT